MSTANQKSDTVAATSLCVLRSTGMKDEIPCSLTGTLRDLKIAISQSSILGMIPVDSQRIFHLGRELKTLGRSLEALGVGRFTGINRTVIHVHAIPSPTISVNKSNDTSSNTANINADQRQQHHQRRRPTAHKSINERSVATTTAPATSLTELEVVDLNSDSDDDCVVIDDDVATAPTTRSKKRRRKT